MTNYGSYKPPFRRYEATNGAPDSGEETVMPTDYQSLSPLDRAMNRGNMRGRGFQTTYPGHAGRGQSEDRGTYDHFTGRGNRGNRGGRGGRGGRGYDNGYGRGQGRGRGRGRGGYHNFSQERRNDQQQLDQLPDGTELYSQRDIENYFWGQGDNIGVDHGSTFHDSQKRPGELAYVQLFANANPRWAADHIVFAKSNLKLLPEYNAKKAEHGEWKIPDATDATKDGETQAQPTQSTSADTDTAEPAAQGDEANSALTAAVSETTTEENKTEVTTPVEATKGDEAPQPAKHVSSSRMSFTDIRNLPPEELQRLEEEQRQQRLARQQQQQGPVFPAIEPIDFAPGPHESIAVFQEHRFPNARPRFAFVGWFKVARINVLAPRSAELVRMQQQKWERRDHYGNIVPTRPRDAAAWEATLGTEWAVVKFEKLAGDDAPAAPAIEKLSRRQAGAEAAPETLGQQQAQTQASEGDGAVDKEAMTAKADTESKLESRPNIEVPISLLQDTIAAQMVKLVLAEYKEAEAAATAGTGEEAEGPDEHLDAVHSHAEQ
ncbi:hypothetical protein F5Y13DRAFT_152676 [Hypoxylon sp. FL1857]|nr:hypothetical protein F5Y13DRAFT_152676 [Hypoxylon sp. FL1857]